MVGIKCNFGKLQKKYTPEQINNAKREMCDQMLSDMTPHVPYRKGGLQGGGHVTSTSLEWNTPYARRQFYENAKNKRWDLKAESLYMENWKSVFVKELMNK